MPKGGVAGEDGERVARVPGDVQVGAGGIERERARTLDALHHAAAVALHLDEGEAAGRDVALEDGDRVLVAARGIDVQAVGADDDRRRGVEAVDLALAVVLRLDVGQLPGQGVAVELEDGVVAATAM